MTDLVFSGVRLTPERERALRYFDGAGVEGSRLPQRSIPTGVLTALERARLLTIEAPGKPSCLMAAVTNRGRRALELVAAPPAERTLARRALRRVFRARYVDELLKAFADPGCNPLVLVELFQALPAVLGGKPPEDGTYVRAWGWGFLVLLGPRAEAPTVIVHATRVPRPATELYSVLLRAIRDPSEFQRATLPTPARWRYVVVGGGKVHEVDYSPGSRDADDKAIAAYFGGGWVAQDG